MTDPFKIDGPATIAFSGGRTSAYMLARIVRAHGGQLPPDVVVCFANTGKEREETLDFVRDVGAWLGAPINWLERGPRGAVEVVGHNSAARAGEPFRRLILEKKYLPNGVTRFCTIELKIRLQARFVVEAFGWRHWTNAVGFRADEMRRVENICGRNDLGKDPFRAVAPLAAAGVDKAEVLAFWRAAPFDLRLKQHEGNCDLCFLKRRDKLREVMFDRPDLAAWWIEQEWYVREHFKPQSGGGFRPPARPDYAQLFATRTKQEELDLAQPDALDLCYCGDAA